MDLRTQRSCADFGRRRRGAVRKRSAKCAWLATPAVREIAASLVQFVFTDFDTRGAKLVGLGQTRFIREQDVYIDEELETDPIYCQFLRPAGFGWAQVR